jgi:hypothetical protein
MTAWPGQVAAPDSNIFFEFTNLANKTDTANAVAYWENSGWPAAKWPFRQRHN